MGDHNRLDAQLVALKNGQDIGDVIAGVDYDGLPGFLVAEDGAIALQHAYGQDFVNQHRFQLYLLTRLYTRIDRGLFHAATVVVSGAAIPGRYNPGLEKQKFAERD
jgi:hypothetical protein